MKNKTNGTQQSLEQVVAHNIRYVCAILLDLRRCKHADERGLEERGNEAGVDGGEGDERGRALLEHRAGGEQLEGERERVQGEEDPDLGTTCI